MPTRLSNVTQEFATSVEEAHEKDLAYLVSQSGRKTNPFASIYELKRRVDNLEQAIRNRTAVNENCARVGSLLLALWRCGNDVVPDPQMELLEEQYAVGRQKRGPGGRFLPKEEKDSEEGSDADADEPADSGAEEDSDDL